ncbi:MAG: hypothetical protein KC593_03375 [Myxococcales bacterium]|nr:hypothetical protein [Myxococcales bacterium]MCB9627962.1 hypothetical protein [Sandaracinaceae bacterium]
MTGPEVRVDERDQPTRDAPLRDVASSVPHTRLVSTLAPNESVRISVMEIGCFHDGSVVVEVHGDAPGVAFVGGRPGRRVPFEANHAARVDAWLAGFRSPSISGSTTAQRLVVRWRRNGAVVARESISRSLPIFDALPGLSPFGVTALPVLRGR